MEDFIIHRIQGYISRMFLIEYDDRMLLIDSGSRNDVARLHRFCREKLKRPMSDITLCVVTHIHPDHAGGAKVLKKKFGIPLAAHRDIDRWYRGPTGSLQHIIDIIMAQSMRSLQGRRLRRAWYSKKLRPDTILDDGDRLPGFPAWEALHIPGHTLHDIAIYHSEKKILYAADAVISERGKFLPPIPVFFRGKMRQSYDKMGALSPRQVLTAHGDDIDESDLTDLFAVMKEKLKVPGNIMTRTAYSVSIFASPVWKGALKNFISRKEKLNKKKNDTGRQEHIPPEKSRKKSNGDPYEK